MVPAYLPRRRHPQAWDLWGQTIDGKLEHRTRQLDDNGDQMIRDWERPPFYMGNRFPGKEGNLCKSLRLSRFRLFCSGPTSELPLASRVVRCSWGCSTHPHQAHSVLSPGISVVPSCTNFTTSKPLQADTLKWQQRPPGPCLICRLNSVCSQPT